MESSGFDEYSHFFEVKIDLFDGPIDLLLHLVKQNELPIEKVSLAEVTHQYLGCLERMQRFDLEIAGEYLVIAATLVSIKSSILLNEPVELISDEEGNLVDPHEELLRRLKAAEIYRDGARQLATRNLLGLDVFASPASLDGVNAPPPSYKEHDPILLGKAFRKLLAQSGAEESLLTISVDSVSIVERMTRVVSLLKSNRGTISFEQLIPDLTSKASVISCFIALLELCKRSIISVRQDDSFERIYIDLAYEQADTTKISSEFDAASGDVSANG